MHPENLMKMRACILAGLVAVAGSVQATNPAFQTARSGWSRDHSCVTDYSRKRASHAGP